MLLSFIHFYLVVSFLVLYYVKQILYYSSFFYFPPLSLLLTHSLTHSHSQTNTHKHTHTHTHTLPLSLSLSLSPSSLLTPSPSPSPPPLLPSRPVLMMVGQAQQDIASQLAQYEISISHDIITEINTMLDVSPWSCVSTYPLCTVVVYIRMYIVPLH